MSKESTTASGGMGCTGLLTILLTVLFIGLKLTNYITWSWIWVLSPLWINGLLVITVILIVLLVGFIYVLIQETKK